MTTTGDTRTPLLAAIEDLRARAVTPAVRIALAEAEFRLAIAADTEPAEAIERLRVAIEQDPFCPKLSLHLGRLLHQSGRPALALSEYRHVIRLAPASRRAHLLLALALLDMGPATRELGDLLIAGLNSDKPADLAAAVAEVDVWLEEQAVPDTGGERRPRRPAVAKPGRHGAPDAWRVRLYQQVTRGKVRAGQLSTLLATGLDRVAEAGEIGEYAIACVLLLAAGQQPRSVRDLGGSVLIEHADHPAVVLLEATLHLAEAGDPAAFVAMATEYLNRGVLPAELVCWLHLAAFGPHRQSPAVDTLALLEQYPQSIRDLDPFKELTLAVLDGCARKAWAEERFAEARLLWQEAGSIDRFRVPVALNLALLAARTRSTEDYGPAWDRLCELLYLRAAGTGDVQLLLADRRTLHLALAQQAQLRHCASSGARDAQTEKELEAWLADADALQEWLRQWDLYYVNARLGFRSPAHLLGVAVDAEEAERAEAKEAFVRHVVLALGGRNWAGTAVFANIAATQAEQAHLTIAGEETRDPYYESEREAAQELAEAALGRGLTLRRMMLTLRESPSAEHLELGCDLARRQLSLPWQTLRQICVERGLIGDDVDLVKLFENDLVALAAYWDEPAAETPDERARRLSIVDKCIELLPAELMLRLLRCRGLRALDWDVEAYAAALEALELSTPDGDEHQQRMTGQLVDLVDLIGWEAIPEPVRKPANSQVAPTREVLVTAVRQALEQFPRSGVLRRQLARQLVATGGVAETNEAIELLGEGVRSALSAVQRAEFAEQLTAIRSAAATVSVRASIRQLVGSAQEAARAAIEYYVQHTGAATKKAALAAVRAAIDQVAEGQRIAEQAGLDDERASLAEVLHGLRDMAAELDDAGSNDEEG
jgi:hypothetical protein